MKKSLLALAVLSALSGVAAAQSSVTLSGAVDLGVFRQNGAWNMQNSGSSRTSFTLSGSEDLGGGMTAFFLMNHRFHLNTGIQRDSGAFWRQGWVGLGGSFGRLRLGKILPPLQELNGQFEICDGDGVTVRVCSTHTGGLYSGHGPSGSRYNNAISYISPSLGGLTVHAMIAASDANSQLNAVSGSERPIGLGVDFAAGPLRVAAAYDRNADDKKTKGVYGSFNAGFATFLAQWENGDLYTRTLPLPAKTLSDASRWSVGAKIPFGAATFKAGYTKWSDEDVKKFGLGLDYSLSKRTTAYTDVGKFSGNGYADAIGGNGSALTDANRKTRFSVGVLHRF